MVDGTAETERVRAAPQDRGGNSNQWIETQQTKPSRTSPISMNATASRRHQRLVALSRMKGYTLFTTNAPTKSQKKYALSGYSVASIANTRSLADWGRG